MPDKISRTLVKHLSLLRIDSAYRLAHNSCLVMGRKAIDEAARRTPPRLVLSEASEDVFCKITGLPHPEPLIAEFPLPPPTPLSACSSLLVLDQLSDPGNVGTILRTALALNWGGVFFIKGGVDPFNDKVLRASKAALFHLPYAEGSAEDLPLTAFTPLVADLEGTPLSSLSPPSRPLLLLSHEARGVCPPFTTLPKVTIPISTESLNVAAAAAILLYTLRSHG